VQAHGPQENLLSFEGREQLERELSTLAQENPGLWQVLHIRYWDELEFEAIAISLDIVPATAWRRVRDAEAKLRTALTCSKRRTA